MPERCTRQRRRQFGRRRPLAICLMAWMWHVDARFERRCRLANRDRSYRFPPPPSQLQQRGAARRAPAVPDWRRPGRLGAPALCPRRWRSFRRSRWRTERLCCGDGAALAGIARSLAAQGHYRWRQRGVRRARHARRPGTGADRPRRDPVVRRGRGGRARQRLGAPRRRPARLDRPPRRRQTARSRQAGPHHRRRRAGRA